MRKNDSYKWSVGVLDSRTDKIIYNVKNLSIKELEIVINELKRKFG